MKKLLCLILCLSFALRAAELKDEHKKLLQDVRQSMDKLMERSFDVHMMSPEINALLQLGLQQQGIRGAIPLEYFLLGIRGDGGFTKAVLRPMNNNNMGGMPGMGGMGGPEGDAQTNPLEEQFNKILKDTGLSAMLAKTTFLPLHTVTKMLDPQLYPMEVSNENEKGLLLSFQPTDQKVFSNRIKQARVLINKSDKTIVQFRLDLKDPNATEKKPSAVLIKLAYGIQTAEDGETYTAPTWISISQSLPAATANQGGIKLPPVLNLKFSDYSFQ